MGGRGRVSSLTREHAKAPQRYANSRPCLRIRSLDVAKRGLLATVKRQFGEESGAAKCALTRLFRKLLKVKWKELMGS